MADQERPTEPAKDDVVAADPVVEPVVAEEPHRSDEEAQEKVGEPLAPEAEVVEELVSVEKPTTQTIKEIRVERKGGFVPMLLGGVAAAAIGYGLSTIAPIASNQAVTIDLKPIETRLSALEGAPDSSAPLQSRVDAVEARIDALPEPSPAPDLSPLQTAIGDMTTRLDGLENRLAILESQPSSEGQSESPAVAAALEAMRQDLESLKAANATAQKELQAMAEQAQARLAEAEAEAARQTAEAEAAAQAALAQSAVGRVRAAVENGSPFADVLPLLEGRTIPQALVTQADSGVPTQSSLEGSFPEAAREALAASIRATMGDSWTDRAAALLRTTTGARSLTPREGDDPDAILSRAEAALKAEELQTALTEISSLPETGQDAMAEWAALAQRRMEALAAVAALADELEG